MKHNQRIKPADLLGAISSLANEIDDADCSTRYAANNATDPANQLAARVYAASKCSAAPNEIRAATAVPNAVRATTLEFM